MKNIRQGFTEIFSSRQWDSPRFDDNNRSRQHSISECRAERQKRKSENRNSIEITSRPTRLSGSAFDISALSEMMSSVRSFILAAARQAVLKQLEINWNLINFTLSRLWWEKFSSLLEFFRLLFSHPQHGDTRKHEAIVNKSSKLSHIKQAKRAKTRKKNLQLVSRCSIKVACQPSLAQIESAFFRSSIISPPMHCVFAWQSLSWRAFVFLRKTKKPKGFVESRSESRAQRLSKTSTTPNCNWPRNYAKCAQWLLFTGPKINMTHSRLTTVSPFGKGQH